MNLSICTISFRHQLISLEQIVDWARERDFHGIELWGVHAESLLDFPHYGPKWLDDYGLSITMISDYLPLDGDEKIAIRKMEKLCRLANYWGVKKVRTFAGNKGSASVESSERDAWVERLKLLCGVAEKYDIYLVVETHPQTLADTLASTEKLLRDIDHPCLKINFDVIHVWEAGDDPQQAFIRLAPFIEHMHLKNIKKFELMNVFSPANVYAPAGVREGMVGILEGAFGFEGFLKFVVQQDLIDWKSLDVSLEWFGKEVLHTLEKDFKSVKGVVSQTVLSSSTLDEKTAIAV